jgi:beta-lactamase class A
MSKTGKLLILIILVLCAAASFYYFVTGNQPDDNSIGDSAPLAPDIGSYGTVSPEEAPEELPELPVQESGTGGSVPSPEAEKERQEELKRLKDDINNYLSEQQGIYGVYFINLETGDEFGINDTEEYIAASTSKLPIILYLYTKIESGEVDPEWVLTYEEEDFEPGTGTVQYGNYGDEYTVREASRLSITISDNCAVNMIIRLCGIENIRQYMLDLGGTIYYGSRHRSCPKDMALYAKELYRLYKDNPSVYGELIKDLEETIFNDRINALLPKEIRVAHKIGNNTGTVNDVGIVFAKQPYVISFMTRDIISGEKANEAIATVSRMVFDYIQAAV